MDTKQKIRELEKLSAELRKGKSLLIWETAAFILFYLLIKSLWKI
jgi:hypothetical protein